MAGTAYVFESKGLSDVATFEGYKVRSARVRFSAAYVAGGDTLLLPSLNATSVVGLAQNPSHVLGSKFTVASTAAELQTGVSVTLAGTPTAPLLQLWATAATEVVNGDYSAVIIPLLFFVTGGSNL